MAEWVNTICEEMSHGNFSFLILIVGFLQLVLLIVDLCGRKK